MSLLLLIAQASPSLAEAAHPGGGVFIPSWIIGLFAGLLVILFGIIGFFLIAQVGSDPRVQQLHAILTELINEWRLEDMNKQEYNSKLEG